MTSRRSSARAALVGAVLLLLTLAGAPARAVAADQLAWSDCGEGFQCATVSVPLDYGDPGKGRTELPVTRHAATDPEHRLGTLFVNFGGPGDPTAETLRSGLLEAFFGVLNQRYDIVAFDPRGTGGPDAINCNVDQETEG